MSASADTLDDGLIDCEKTVPELTLPKRYYCTLINSITNNVVIILLSTFELFYVALIWYTSNNKAWLNFTLYNLAITTNLHNDMMLENNDPIFESEDVSNRFPPRRVRIRQIYSLRYESCLT